ncbi:MAG: hypothetical protein LBJ44_01170 [Propionibacteriaceae bacterium]|nr:hypothetical protein [Propionibacteriaceae bacterium]
MTDYFGPTPEQKVVIEQATYAMTRHCMAERGFEMLEDPPSTTPQVPSSPGYDGYLGILDRDYAAERGYQLKTRPELTQPKPPVPGWTAAYETALKGDDGCALKTNAFLEEYEVDVPRSTQDLVIQIEDGSVDQAWLAPEVAEALFDWRSCMAQEGYSFENPRVAYQSFTGFAVTSRYPIPGMAPPAPGEIETALRDVQCKQESGLVPVWRRNLWQIRYDAMQANLPVLQVYQQITELRLANAQEMIRLYG